MLKRWYVAWALVGLASSCAQAGGDGGDDAPPPDAQLICQCDDGDACTVDTCVNEVCSNVAIDPTGSQIFTMTGGLQTFTVPECETSLVVDARGAAGGSATGALGGKGAQVVATVPVNYGETITILVGNVGANATDTDGQRAGAGGGGTFVVSSMGQALVVAGGGGGAERYSGAGIAGGPGMASTSGAPGGGGDIADGGAGGVGGNGGVTAFFPDGYHTGTGGGGFLSDGIGSSAGRMEAFGTPNNPGHGFASDGAGGVGGSQGHNGGYGGGGSAGFTGGGGGGYSGGGGGGVDLSNPNLSYGGGGGSYSVDNAANMVSGVNAGAGTVTVTW